MKADKLILGKIYTLDERDPLLEAMTIKDGLVQYAGSRAIAEQLCDEHTEVMDYGDKYIYPGFMDAHCHGTMACMRLYLMPDIRVGQTMDEYVQMMKKIVDENPDADHYWACGWQDRDKAPTRQMLDAICPDKPMCLNSVDGHSMWFNTKGMEYFNVFSKEAVEEWGTDIILVDEEGIPTGRISEGPGARIMTQMSDAPDEELKKGYLKWQEFALSQGITAYYEAGVNERSCRIYHALEQEGKLKTRVYAGWMIDDKSEDYVKEVQKAAEMAKKYNGEYFQIIGIKIFMDGVVEAHTAWLLEPYADQPDYTGVKRMCDKKRVVDMYLEANKYGFNVHQHTIGDGAVRFAVDCIEEAQIKSGNMNMRNVIAHVQMADPEDLKRLAALNGIAAVAPLWMRKEPDYYYQGEEYLGARRAFYQYPLKSIVNYNGIMAFHTDYPVSPDMSNPETVYSAVERNFPDGEMYTQLNTHESLNQEEAVSGMTVGPAYSFKQENRLGKLKIGYIANAVVYDKDFFEDDINAVAKSKLVATIIDGNEVYHA